MVLKTHIHENICPGLNDPNRAGELYSEAAEAAMEELCGKLANK